MEISYGMLRFPTFQKISTITASHSTEFNPAECALGLTDPDDFIFFFEKNYVCGVVSNRNIL